MFVGFAHAHHSQAGIFDSRKTIEVSGVIKSENNRRARYYTLTAAGRKRLRAENEEFDRMIAAIQMVLRKA
jgi:DNA-binding PadR family transcriptional regulator